MDKAMSPKPLDPEMDCTLALQIPVAYPGGETVYLYPSLLEEEVMDDTSIINHSGRGSPADSDPVLLYSLNPQCKVAGTGRPGRHL